MNELAKESVLHVGQTVYIYRSIYAFDFECEDYPKEKYFTRNYVEPAEVVAIYADTFELSNGSRAPISMYDVKDTSFELGIFDDYSHVVNPILIEPNDDSMRQHLFDIRTISRAQRHIRMNLYAFPFDDAIAAANEIQAMSDTYKIYAVGHMLTLDTLKTEDLMLFDYRLVAPFQKDKLEQRARKVKANLLKIRSV